MAPQPVPQQPNMSWDQILPYFAMMNNKKGSMNADISTLFDPQFGFMSGSYNQTSPQDLDSLYATQTNAVKNSGDQNLLGILGAMENGKSAFQIKQSINQKISDGSLPPDPDGSGKSYLDLVDTLFREQQTVKEKMFDQNKIFTNAGLPTPDQRFDPQTYMSEPFNAIDEKTAANQPKVDAALATIKAKYDSMNKIPLTNPTAESKSLDFFIKNLGTKTGGKKVRSQQDANFMGVLAGRIKDISAGKPILSGVNADGSGKWYRKEDLPGLIAQLEKKSGYNVDMKLPKSQEQKIRDSNRQLEIERAGGKAKQIISPNSTNQQPAYNPYDEKAKAEQMKQLISQKISQGLDQRGETPTNVAMLQRLLLNQNSKG
jgi:hypothetical protein